MDTRSEYKENPNFSAMQVLIGYTTRCERQLHGSILNRAIILEPEPLFNFSREDSGPGDTQETPQSA